MSASLSTTWTPLFGPSQAWFPLRLFVAEVGNSVGAFRGDAPRGAPPPLVIKVGSGCALSAFARRQKTRITLYGHTFMYRLAWSMCCMYRVRHIKWRHGFPFEYFRHIFNFVYGFRTCFRKLPADYRRHPRRRKFSSGLTFFPLAVGNLHKKNKINKYLRSIISESLLSNIS